jgi:alpha-1,2-mannosyltransferase
MVTRDAAEARVSGTGGPPGAATDARETPWRVYAVIAACTAAALVLRLFQLTRPGYLLGVTEYDDGVLFGNAVRLADGVIPYRDFAMVQPPGSMLLMVPVALIAKVTGTAWGLGLARILTVCADTACVALLGLLVRHRGPLTAGVACGIYAVYPGALVASHTFMLEPWLNLFCLAGALLVFDRDQFAGNRRLLIGGVAFGFAVAIKLWAVFPLLLIGLLLVRAPRRLAMLAAGALAGVSVPVLPFLILAPHGLITGAVTSQFVRSSGPHTLLPRLADIAGLSVFPPLSAQARIVVLIAMAAYLVIGYLAVMSIGGGLPRPLDWYALIGLPMVIVMFLLPQGYYTHYPAFAGPFIALAFALPIGLLRPAGLGRQLAAASVLGVVAAALIGTVGVRQVQAEAQLKAWQHPARTADRLIPPGSCVLTDDPVLAIVSNRFVAASPACPQVVDAYGTLMVMTSGRTENASHQDLRAVELAWQSWFAQADYFWLEPDSNGQIPWSLGLYDYFTRHFRLIGLRSGFLPRPHTPHAGLYIRR